MDFLEESFLQDAGWDIQSSYANVVLSSQNILDFAIPSGSALHISSQPSPFTFTGYTLKNLGHLRGSVAYLYASRPFLAENSSAIPLSQLVECYRKQSPDNVREAVGGTLLYGRMFMPSQSLEAMAIFRRPGGQLLSKWICDPRLKQPVVLTSALQLGGPNSTREWIWSTHENLIGFRTLANVASWDRDGEPSVQSTLATGMEVFYAVNKKSPGLSGALRYSTQSRYTGTPLTLTAVTNPLMGSLSVAYALKPTPLSAFATRYDFNLYSYHSDLSIGCELWRTQPISGEAAFTDNPNRGPISVFKASTSLASQTAKLLWEGTYRGFLVSSGVQFCYGNRAIPAEMGIEFVYSS